MKLFEKKSVYIGEGANTRILVVSRGTVLSNATHHREPSPVSQIGIIHYGKETIENYEKIKSFCMQRYHYYNINKHHVPLL